MGSNQATLLLLERAGILLEKREARRRQWQELYAGGQVFVPNGLRLIHDAEGRALVAWPWPHPEDEARVEEFFAEFAARGYKWDDELARKMDDLFIVGGGDHLPGGKWADDRGILDAFIRLADEERPEPFLEFARRYGPIELCMKHGLPARHFPLAEERSKAAWPCGAWLFKYESLSYWGVPVDLWRQYAEAVRAVLIAAASLHREELIPEEVWPILGVAPWLAIITREETFLRSLLFRGAVRGEREFLGLIINIAILSARLAPSFQWTDTFPYIGLSNTVSARVVALNFQWSGTFPYVGLSTGGTYGAIIRQLVLSVAQVRGVAVCVGCGQPFVPRRRWKYCQSCGKRAADREAQRRRRARLATKK